MDMFRVLVGLILVTVCGSLGVVLIIVWRMDDLPPTTLNNKFCLPTEQGELLCDISSIRLPNYLDSAISNKYKRKREEKVQEIHSYFDDEDTPMYHEDAAEYWEGKPAARVCGKTLNEPLKNIKPNVMETISQWTLRTSFAFLRQGVRFNDKGRFVVPVAGRYFVYSFIDFYEPCIHGVGKPDIDDPDSPIKHGLYKFNILEAKEKTLILSQQPHKWSINRYYNSYSSYISSLAELSAGDEIYVKVSNVTNLDYADDNFFGINLI